MISFHSQRMIAGAMNKCIFCLRQDRKFSGEEHIIPEGMGNKELILPKGVVCDVCNHGVLSRIDEELLNFEPIKYIRLINNVKTKSGASIDANFGAMSFKRMSDDNIYVTVPGPVQSKKHFEKTDEGFRLHMTGRKLTPKYAMKLARSLYKIGYELVYLDHGPEFIFSSRFDKVRQLILNENEQFHGYLAIPKNMSTESNSSQVRIRYREVNIKNSRPFFMFEFYYQHLAIFYDFERRIIEDQDTLKSTFNILRF